MKRKCEFKLWLLQKKNLGIAGKAATLWYNIDRKITIGFYENVQKVAIGSIVKK